MQENTPAPLSIWVCYVHENFYATTMENPFQKKQVLVLKDREQTSTGKAQPSTPDKKQLRQSKRRNKHLSLLSTWMSQEDSKRLVSGLQPQYIPPIYK